MLCDSGGKAHERSGQDVSNNQIVRPSCGQLGVSEASGCECFDKGVLAVCARIFSSYAGGDGVNVAGGYGSAGEFCDGNGEQPCAATEIKGILGMLPAACTLN